MRSVWRSGVVAAVGALCSGLAAPALADTLADALNLAYQTNPTLRSERAQLRSLDESYIQARAGLRPQVSGSVEFDYTKSPSTLQSEDKDASASLSLAQPIYTGGSATAQMRAAMDDILSGRQKLRETEAQVMAQVIQAYVDVRRDQEGVRIAQDNIDALRRQLDETDARFKVGDLTRTDQAEAEARMAAGQAQLAIAQGQLAVSRSNYVAVVGQSPGDLAPEPALTGLPATVDEAFTVADHENGGILAADFAERAAAQRVAEAKAANRPNVSVRATYGYTGLVNVQNPYLAELYPQIPGVYAQNVTASAVFTQPFYTGGMNSSRIREALEDDNVQMIAIDTARRSTVQAVAQAWAQLLATRAGVIAYQKQVDADKVAFEGARLEAQGGLRSTIDVLNEEQELHSAEFSLVGAVHDEYVAEASVLSAMGRLEARNLGVSDTLYDPAKSFKKVVNGGIGLPWNGVVAAVDALGAPAAPKAGVAGAQVLP